MSAPVAVLTAIVAALLLVTVALGLVSLLTWLRFQQAPAGKVATHITLQLASIMLWAAFIATANLWIAWLTFVVITAGQVFGDLLMFASYRARHRVAGAVSYPTVAADVLGFSRPVPALHATLGALAYFTMLATCITAVLG